MVSRGSQALVGTGLPSLSEVHVPNPQDPRMHWSQVSGGPEHDSFLGAAT